MTRMHDVDAIVELIETQFAALNWAPGRDPDWMLFESGFRSDATLIPAARPAVRQSLGAFRSRLDGLRGNGLLHSFSERRTVLEIQIAGNVAVALAGCEMTENDKNTTHDVSALLLVKDEDGWRIANQAWDAVGAGAMPRT
ncbi:MAG: nuclear transport factor 2 family protein [Pseudomonadota bacterium]